MKLLGFSVWKIYYTVQNNQLKGWKTVQQANSKNKGTEESGGECRVRLFIKGSRHIQDGE